MHRPRKVVVRLACVSRTYGSGAAAVTALEDVSMELLSGEFVALAGPSGSGKTTLLSLIAGLDAPSAGQVDVDGQPLAHLSDAELSRLRLRRLGIVFQNFSLVPVLSAAENVEFPLLFRPEIAPADRRQRTARALERVGVSAAARRRPHELSAGERQRVGIARAIAGSPAMVIADEPTANLDRDSGTAVIHLLREINRERGTTCLYATHDTRLIGLADRVISLREGRSRECVA